MTGNLLELRDISRSFPIRRGIFGRRTMVHAVDAVSLDIKEGQTLALVGESGSGKSTTGKVALGLEKPDTGEVFFRGMRLAEPDTSAWRAERAAMQMIYQDPMAALDRRLTIAEQVREPLDIHAIGSLAERTKKTIEALGAVGLNQDLGERYPHELSGGQRQRVILARALATQPSLLVCDEPVSALDVSIQAQVVNLLIKLQRELRLTLLFISHDLKVVRQISQEIAVMYLGRIVERGETLSVLSRPLHPYTRALVSAVPVPGRRLNDRIILTGEPPNPAARPTGCAFHPRCPAARSICFDISPKLSASSSGRMVACHAADETEGVANKGQLP